MKINFLLLAIEYASTLVVTDGGRAPAFAQNDQELISQSRARLSPRIDGMTNGPGGAESQWLRIFGLRSIDEVKSTNAETRPHPSPR